MEKTYIYGLMEDNLIKYIGKSNNPKKRYNEHINESLRDGDTHKHRWIRKMLNNNKEIKLIILEEVSDKWEEREKYWIKFYGINNLTNHSNGGLGGTIKKNWLIYEDAKLFVHNLKLNNIKEWKEYCLSGLKPENIPAYPCSVYSDKWISYGNWLGTNRVATQKRKYLSFNDCKCIIHNLKLKNEKEWKEYCLSGLKPQDIPSYPQKTYKNQWKGFSDWLGVKRLTKNFYFSFEESKEYVKNIGLINYNEWLKYCKSVEKSPMIPSNPDKKYKNSGWISWGDFLGTSRISNKLKKKK